MNLKLTFNQILNNYTLLSDITHTLSQSQSLSKKESQVKFKTQNYINKNKNIYSWGLQSVFMGSFYLYCFKAKKAFPKVCIGLFYSSIFSFILNFGSHLGVLFSLNTVIQNYQNLENSDSQIIINYVISKIIENSKLKLENKKEIEDSVILEESIKIINKNNIKNKSIDSYLKNNYFSENKVKYMIGNDNEFQLFMNPENSIKKNIPYLPDNFNNFFTHNIYFSISRYFNRLFIYLGIKKEEEF